MASDVDSPSSPISTSKVASTEAIRARAASSPSKAANTAEEAIGGAAAISTIASARFTETLIELDTEIARSIEEWMEREFPQFLQRELALMQTRLHKQLHEHLNATLLSEISTHISRHLGHSPLPEQTQD